MTKWFTCHRCHRESKRVVEAYWGGLLCPWCCREVAELHDLKGDWPPVRWADNESEAA